MALVLNSTITQSTVLCRPRRLSSEQMIINEELMKLSVLMPVFNEVETIAAIVERVLAVPLDLEIILVNDASSDGTAVVLARLATPNLKIIHHPVNRGKGAAIRTALEVATGDVIV